MWSLGGRDSGDHVQEFFLFLCIVDTKTHVDLSRIYSICLFSVSGFYTHIPLTSWDFSLLGHVWMSHFSPLVPRSDAYYSIYPRTFQLFLVFSTLHSHTR